MKKIFLVLLAMTLVLGFLALDAFAQKAGKKPGEGMVIYAQMGGQPGAVATINRELGADDAVAAWGCKVIKQYSDWQSDKMVQQLKEAGAARPDGIVIMGHPGVNAMAPFVDEAVAKGIIVTTNNTALPDLENKYVAKGFGYVGLDLYDSGVALARQMIQMAKLKRGDKVIIYGLKSQPVRGQCDVGAEKIFNEAGLKVIYQEISEEVNADMTLAVPVMVGLLTANPDAKAFMGIHGGVTAVAKEALVAAGRKPADVTFGGIDLSPKIIEGIKEGYVDIVIDQQIYLQGYLPIEQVCLTKLYGFSGLHVNTGSGFVTTENIKMVEPLIKKGIR